MQGEVTLTEKLTTDTDFMFTADEIEGKLNYAINKISISVEEHFSTRSMPKPRFFVLELSSRSRTVLENPTHAPPSPFPFSSLLCCRKVADSKSQIQLGICVTLYSWGSGLWGAV